MVDTHDIPKLTRLIGRGLRRRCPCCGQGKLYQGFYQLKEQCENCGWSFARDPMDLLALMYISTAFITGLGILAMLLLVPSQQNLGRVVMALVALAVIIGTLPMRKGLAIAVDYWLERWR